MYSNLIVQIHLTSLIAKYLVSHQFFFHLFRGDFIFLFRDLCGLCISLTSVMNLFIFSLWTGGNSKGSLSNWFGPMHAGNLFLSIYFFIMLIELFGPSPTSISAMSSISSKPHLRNEWAI